MRIVQDRKVPYGHYENCYEFQLTVIWFTLNIVACITASHDNASEFTLFTSFIAPQLFSYTVLLSVHQHSKKEAQ
jgi:hypothetical protein